MKLVYITRLFLFENTNMLIYKNKKIGKKIIKRKDIKKKKNELKSKEESIKQKHI